MRWKAKQLSDWHAHFAWLPTKVMGEWVWMERVLRRGHGRLQPTSKDGKWNWEFVNSEFDLIKQAEEKGRYAEDAGQVTQGPINVGQGLMKAQASIKTATQAYKTNMRQY